VVELAENIPRPYVLPSTMKRVASAPMTNLALAPEKAFNCPHCRAYAQQTRMSACYRVAVLGAQRRYDGQPIVGWWFVLCTNCDQVSVWLKDRMIYPDVEGGPQPRPDLPEDIRRDYLEAQAIVGRSPRGAAALLRLCIQKLCKHLGEKGKDLNTDIASLVKKRLSVEVQQALDAVRVIGNDAVHPGQMDLRDDRQTAETLFQLVNLVVQRMISEPKAVRAVYEGLPQAALDAINKRDHGKP
jgi:Domain of unknown function (DUF4145)